MSVTVISGGHVSVERTNAEHALRINVTDDFNSIRFLHLFYSSELIPVSVSRNITAYKD